MFNYSAFRAFLIGVFYTGKSTYFLFFFFLLYIYNITINWKATRAPTASRWTALGASHNNNSFTRSLIIIYYYNRKRNVNTSTPLDATAVTRFRAPPCALCVIVLFCWTARTLVLWELLCIIFLWIRTHKRLPNTT